MVVAEQRAGAVDDLDRAAVVHGQRVRDGAREQPLVVDEERRVGAGVAVDALVVVADAEHVERRQRQQAHEQDVGRREVLELVDEEVAARALHRAAERAVGEQHLDGAVDLLVEVDRAAPGELLAERREQLGQARDVVARRLDDLRIGEPEADRRQPLDVRADRVGVGPSLALAGEQRVDEAAHLGLVDHRRRPAAVLGQHPQAERVEGADAGPEVGGAGLHLQLGLLVVGDGEHGRRLVAAVEVEVAQALGEDARLARAGRGDDAGRAAGVGDGGQLVGREVGARGDLGGHDGQRAEVDRVAVDERSARPGAGMRGPPSIHAGVPSGRVMSASPSGVAAAPSASRAALTPHHHVSVAGAGVVGVGPGQEVQAVEPRLGLGRHPPRLDRERLRFPERRPGRCRGRSPPARAGPTPRAAGARWDRVGEHGVVDRDDRRVAPRRRRLGAGRHDDAPTERRRTRDGHARQPTRRVSGSDGRLLCQRARSTSAAGPTARSGPTHLACGRRGSG